MHYNLANQRVVITGITGGIARASAQLLLSLGSEVIVTARDEEKLKIGMEGLTGNISGEVMDLSDEETIKTFFNKVGSFDHLVTPAASNMFAPLESMDFAAAKELITTKLWGQMLCLHHALPHIKKTGSVTLFSGTVTQKPLLGGSMFAAVGGGSEAAGRVWALELAPLRINTVVPGIVETNLWQDVTGSQEAAQDQLSAIAEFLPVKRVGQAEDIAKAVAFLIDNSFVDGISLVVDGGHRLV